MHQGALFLRDMERQGKEEGGGRMGCEGAAPLSKIFLIQHGALNKATVKQYYTNYTVTAVIR